MPRGLDQDHEALNDSPPTSTMARILRSWSASDECPWPHEVTHAPAYSSIRIAAVVDLALGLVSLVIGPAQGSDGAETAS